MPSATPAAPSRDSRGVVTCCSRSLPGSVRAQRPASPVRGVATLELDTRATSRCVRTATRFCTCHADRGVSAYLTGGIIACGGARGLPAALGSAAAEPFTVFAAAFARCAATPTVRAAAVPAAALPTASFATAAPAAAALSAAAFAAASLAAVAPSSPLAVTFDALCGCVL